MEGRKTGIDPMRRWRFFRPVGRQAGQKNLLHEGVVEFDTKDEILEQHRRIEVNKVSKAAKDAVALV